MANQHPSVAAASSPGATALADTLPPTGSRPAGVSGPVRTAFVLWMIAIGAGVFETVLAVINRFAEGSVSPGEIVVGVGVRLAVFVVAGFLAIRMRQGRHWARLALALLLGVVGTLSLVIDPIQWLLAGNSLNAAVADLTLTDLLFATSRIVHLGAVLGAMVSMFRPDANTYFRTMPSKR